MKTLVPLLISVVALGIAVTALVRPPPPAPVTPVTPPPPARPDPALAVLREEVAGLQRQLAELRERPLPAPPPAPAVDPQQVRDLVRAELRQQGGPGRGWSEPDPAEQQTSLRSEVGLDEAQATRVVELLTAHRTSLRELFHTTSDRANLPKAMAEAGQKLDAAIAEAVGADKAAAVQEWIRKRDPMRGGRGRRGGEGDAPPATGREF